MTYMKLLVLAAVLLLLAPPHHSSAQPDTNIIKIATQSPLTNNASPQGEAIVNGTQLAIDQLGGRLRDNGFELQLVSYDDDSSPEVGVANAREIIADPQILAVIGHYNSGVAIPSSEVYNEANLVMVSPANTAALVTDRGLPIVNRVCGRDDVEGLVGAQHLESIDVRSVYIIHESDVYGEGLAMSFRNNAVELGIEILGYESIDSDGSGDYQDVAQRVSEADPDVVYLAGTVMGNIAQQLSDAGYDGQLMGGNGLDTPNFAALGGEIVEGAYFTTALAQANVHEDAEQFIADYTDAFGVAPIGGAAEAYDATGIVLRAIEWAIEFNNGNLPTRAEVAAEVRATVDYDGITGLITFDENGDREEGNYFVIEVQHSDPQRWLENRAVNHIQVLSPIAQEYARFD